MMYRAIRLQDISVQYNKNRMLSRNFYLNALQIEEIINKVNFCQFYYASKVIKFFFFCNAFPDLESS